MNRIEAIKNYRKRENDKKFAERKREQEEIAGLKEEVKALRPRIEELIETANTCLENDIFFDTPNSYNNEKGFLADSVTHYVGFIQGQDRRVGFARTRPICFVGIRGGDEGYGECDFITDGYEMFMIKNEDVTNSYVKEPTKEYLSMFVKQFDTFEKNFYEYVDNIIKE